MKSIVLAAIAAFFSPAVLSASLSVRQGADSVILFDQACPAAVSERIKPEHRPDFLKATVMLNGRAKEGCWTLADKDTVFVMLDDGGGIVIPAKLFKQDLGV